MKKVLKNIVVSFIILSNLMFMVGFNLYHHICHTSQTATISLFIESKCDHHNNSQSEKHVEDSELPDCCKTNHANEEEETPSQFCNDNLESSCCDNTSEHFSIEDNYNFTINKIKIINSYILDYQISLLDDLIYSKAKEENSIITSLNFENLPQRFNISYIHSTSMPS